MPDVLDPEELTETNDSPAEEQAEADPLKDRPELQAILYELAEKCYGYDKLPRRQEVMDTRQQRFYWRKIQYIWWNESRGCFFSVPQGGGSYSYGSTSVDMPRYTDVYDIYGSFGRTIIAAFTQNPPGVRFQPEDPKDGDDLAAKAQAEKYRHHFDRINDNKKLQQDLARFYWTDTRIATVTEFDEELGHSSSRAFGTLETKCPVMARDLKECPYFFVSFEREMATAKSKLPEDVAAKIKPGTSKLGSEYERLARMGVLQGAKTLFQSGESQGHIVTEHWCWFRPEQFSEYRTQTAKMSGGKAVKVAKVGAEQSIEQELLAIFPDGCKVKFVGDIYCCSKQESMDDRVDVSFPLPGDGMNRSSMGYSLVPVQDTVNDSFNLWKETNDYCIPVTWMDCQWGDIEAIRSQISEPGNHLPFVGNKGAVPGALQDKFFVEPPAAVSESFIQFIEMLTGPLPQFITGALPSLFGGNMQDQKTAAAYAMAREQAMGQMALPWGSLQRHFAGIYEKAAIDEAAHREGDEINVEMPGDNGQTKIDTLDFSALGGGRIKCYPDVDSSFPETYAAKRQNFFQFIQLAGPAAMQLINTPNNWEEARDMIGLEELEFPGQEACEKQRREIAILLRDGSVVPDKQAITKEVVGGALAQATGQPAPQQAPQELVNSSVKVDAECDMHNFEWEEVQRWLSSQEGQDAKESNPGGWMNVRTHGLEHKAIMDQQAAQQAMQAMLAKGGPPKPAGPPVQAA